MAYEDPREARMPTGKTMITEIADVERLLASIETNTRVQTELLQRQVVLMEHTQKRIEGFADIIRALIKSKQIDKVMGDAYLKVLLIENPP